MRRKTWLAAVAVLAIVRAEALASPPIDVTRPELPRTRRQNAPVAIRDEDLVYQDVNDPAPEADKDTATVRVDTIGRGLPHREGKPLLRLSPADRVKVLRESRDKRWLAVQALRSGRKAWVPRVALTLPKPEKAKLKKPASPPPEGATADEENDDAS